MVCKKKGEQREREILLLFEGEKQKTKKIQTKLNFQFSADRNLCVEGFFLVRYYAIIHFLRGIIYIHFQSISEGVREGQRKKEKSRVLPWD